MKNLFKYLEYYGNESFNRLAFNDVDSLILAELVYAKFKNIAPSGKNRSMSLKEICELFLLKYNESNFKSEDYLFPNSYRLVKFLKDCRRFNLARISYYIEEVGKKTQFGAMTVRFPNGICYVAFEGTDSTISGWVEDFELMYKNPTISQAKGVKYLNDTIRFYDRVIYVGGHSKGGNIAMYSYMNAKSSIKRRVKNVYNFDGPGFLDEVIVSYDYKEMIPKLKMFVPEQSVIGMMLGHDSYYVVKSNGLGFLQHDGFTWCCFGGCLETGSLSKRSLKLEDDLKDYLLSMSLEEKKMFVNTLDNVCENLGIKNIMQFREIKLTSFINFFHEIKNVPNDMKRRFLEVIKMIVF